MRMLREEVRHEHHGEEMDEERLTALVHERVLRAVPHELWEELYTLMVDFLTQFLMEAHSRDTRDRQ
ncbi:unnamed protein product [Heligmosomoides polygyrus]|uniref:Uncharacterized protein n=1 Tax=Heligmosomoides polygyrus TaxID=6339 RepID=A0A183GQZ6_HELPZ|nr:unnamed protein product [Heligmosomoides polygyrus]